MQWLEAMTLLGLTCSDCQQESAINKAWKQKVRRSHPDKNHVFSMQATQQTQRLNQAREVLLGKLAQDLKDTLWKADYDKRMAALQAQRAVLEKEKQQDVKLTKYFADIIREADEAGANKKEREHQERTEYLKTFRQRMRDYKARTRKRARREQS
jgi:DnaJ-class molecular chaperone